MKVCQRCGGQNHDQAQWCQFCGFQFQLTSQYPSVQPASQYPPQQSVPDTLPESNNNFQKKSKTPGCVTVLLWIVFFPIMLSVLAFRKKKTYLYVISGVVWLVFIIVFFANNAANHSPAKIAGRTSTAVYKAVYATYTEAARPTETQAIDRNIKVIMDATGLSLAESEKAFEVIKSVGFEKVKKLELFNRNENTILLNADFGFSNIYAVSFVDGEINNINDPSGPVYYNRNEGGVVDNVNNYRLTSVDQYAYTEAIMTSVKSILKTPSTAKFPSFILSADQWSFARDKDIVTVKSYVDSQNAFGAMIRSNFYGEYSHSGGNLTCLIFEGRLVYGACQLAN